MIEMNGKEYEVTLLTLDQDEILSEIVDNDILAKIGEFISSAETKREDFIPIAEVVLGLFKTKKIRKFLATILVEEGREFDASLVPEMEKVVGNMNNEQIYEAVSAFFTINASSLTSLSKTGEGSPAGKATA